MWERKKEKAKVAILRQNRLQNNDYNKRQRRALYNAKGFDPTRRYNKLYIYIYTHDGAIKYAKQIFTKEGNESNIVIVMDFNILHQWIDDSDRKKKSVRK